MRKEGGREQMTAGGGASASATLPSASSACIVGSVRDLLSCHFLCINVQQAWLSALTDNRPSSRHSWSCQLTTVMMASAPEPSQLKVLLDRDGYLNPYVPEIKRRYRVFRENLERLESLPGGLEETTLSYKKYGVHVLPDNSIHCLEWCPGVDGLALVGDFNNWDANANTYERLDHGQWSLVIPPVNGQTAIHEGSVFKIVVKKHGQNHFKLSPWAQYVEKAKTNIYEMVFHHPKEYQWKHGRVNPTDSLRIYEAHVGISSPEGKVNTYRNFADDVVPYIKDQGYNVIQLMAIMEHAYYGSFGYQVTSFFAPSSRFGKPEDLKYLIDKAHSEGITVLLDVVLSHASKNVEDGLNQWNLTDAGYFHGNGRGFHPQWDSRLFDYTNIETQRFLLSNLRYWQEEYRFDGFRFDGVTSMLYHSHGLGDSFCSYDDYFGLNADSDSIVFLALSNYLIKKYYPGSVSIAEEFSGMPALCRPIEEGGQGFDFRLAMSLPDMWIKILKHQQDEDWKLEEIVHTLENRRYQEKNVAYAESHDQALVGDKSLAFWLMDKEMYDFMAINTPYTPIIERGIALHNIIRLLTYGLGGEAWLNFIGNEFGHPEWLDFPREGNNQSYHYARRQFNLYKNENLRYKFMGLWDKAMNKLEQEYHFLSRGPIPIGTSDVPKPIRTSDDPRSETDPNFG
uniref:1,4-alpha-glucan branching enzyme n=1 Tax=Panagrellus redivivus TaxID=6233 RepID=A0A7E4V834_PANRE